MTVPRAAVGGPVRQAWQGLPEADKAMVTAALVILTPLVVALLFWFVGSG